MHQRQRFTSDENERRIAFKALERIAVKQYYVEIVPVDNGIITKIHRRKKEIPYLDIAMKYPLSEIDADGKYDIKHRSVTAKPHQTDTIPDDEEIPAAKVDKIPEPTKVVEKKPEVVKEAPKKVVKKKGDAPSTFFGTYNSSKI